MHYPQYHSNTLLIIKCITCQESVLQFSQWSLQLLFGRFFSQVALFYSQLIPGEERRVLSLCNHKHWYLQVWSYHLSSSLDFELHITEHGAGIAWIVTENQWLPSVFVIGLSKKTFGLPSNIKFENTKWVNEY